MQTAARFDLETTYVHLTPDGTASQIVVDESFWPDVMSGARHDFDTGAVVAAFPYASDWESAEAHPAGDELVILLEGEIDLVLERDDGDERVRLRAGETTVVPRGVWHHADVHRPGAAIHVTFGAGTTHRPARR